MSIRITALRYEGVIIGLRFKTPQGTYDADRFNLRRVGIYNVDVPIIEDLFESGNLLITEEEHYANLKTEDISESPKLEQLVSTLRGNKRYESFFYIKKPHEQTLKDFLNSGWTPERVSRKDEYNGQHNLFLPDGSRYRGGWVGKGRSHEVVLSKFHYESCYWWMHKGGVFADDILKPYKDLMQYNDIIKDIKQKIKVRTLENNGLQDLILLLPSKDKQLIEFTLSEYAPLSRWQQRSLANTVDLDYLGLSNINLPTTPTLSAQSPTELIIMALMRQFYESTNTAPKMNHYEPIH